MDYAQRNRSIKAVLAKRFGAGKVRVRGGKGSSYGWAYIDIDYTPLDQDEARALSQEVVQLLDAAGLKFSGYYSDDYSDQRTYPKRSIQFNTCRYWRTFRGQIDGTLYGQRSDRDEWEAVR